MSSKVTQANEGYGLKTVRYLDIGYAAIIYFVFGLIIAKIMDMFYGDYKYRDERAKSTSRVTMEIIGMMWLNGVIIYFFKYMAGVIPFPLTGVAGYERTTLQDVANTGLFVYSFMYFQKHFMAKLRGLYNRINAPPPRPVLTRAQIAIIQAQIRKQLQEQNIRDRKTMKAIYDAAMSQALNRAVMQARRAEEDAQAAGVIIDSVFSPHALHSAWRTFFLPRHRLKKRNALVCPHTGHARSVNITRPFR
jgi:hypothetical protein